MLNKKHIFPESKINLKSTMVPWKIYVKAELKVSFGARPNLKFKLFFIKVFFMNFRWSFKGIDAKDFLYQDKLFKSISHKLSAAHMYLRCSSSPLCRLGEGSCAMHAEGRTRTTAHIPNPQEWTILLGMQNFVHKNFETAEKIVGDIELGIHQITTYLLRLKLVCIFWNQMLVAKIFFIHMS